MYIEPVSPSTVIAVTNIINNSLDTGIIPDDFKIAKAIPIYKSSDPFLLKNYSQHFQNYWRKLCMTISRF